MSIELHRLTPARGATRKRKSERRGQGTGTGQTSGRGDKGQKSRSGASIRPGFEGGQMPLARRLPKKGFTNGRFKETYAILNVSDLEVFFEAGASVDEASLRAVGLVKGTQDGVKILGDGDLTKKLKVQADKISATAREKIEKAGGEIVAA